jgi:hypothetical protein
MSKKKIVLRFPTLYVLWNFAQTLHGESVEVNTNNKTLICDCTESEVAIAVEAYRATVLEEITDERGQN